MSGTPSTTREVPSILVVDDDQLLRETLCRVLVRAGYDVLEAASGSAALTICGSQRTDVVVTDIVMPDGEGLEMIRTLQRAYPAVKILAMSGGGGKNARTYLQLAQLLGANGTLAKPFSGVDLLDAVEAVLASHTPAARVSREI